METILTVLTIKQCFDVNLNLDEMSTIYKQYINNIYENYFRIIIMTIFLNKM